MESAEPNSGTKPSAAVSEITSWRDLRTQFADLFQAFEKEVFAFIFRDIRNKETAWDLTQQTFLQAWKAFDRFDSSQDGRSWVMTIARNVVFSHFRSEGAQKRGRPISLDQIVNGANNEKPSRVSAEPIDRDCPDPSEKLIRDEAIDAMDRAAGQLNEKDRELYRLCRAGLSTAEIAKKTGRSKTAIGPALTRLYAKLRRKLTPDQP